jgi:hypothetical protein
MKAHEQRRIPTSSSFGNYTILKRHPTDDENVERMSGNHCYYIRPVIKNEKACFFDFSMIEHLLGPILIPQIDLVLLYLLAKFQPYTSSID